MSLKSIKKLIGRYIFYTCFFFLIQWISRGIFIFHESLHLQLTESVFSTYTHGFALDLAFTSYIMGLFLVLDILFPYSWKNLRSIAFAVLSFLILFLSFADRYLYDVWTSKFNQDALHFMQHPKEAMASAEHLPFVKITGIAVLISVMLFFLFRRVYGILDFKIKPFPKWLGIATMALLVALGSRQSLSVAPIGPSAAYYSKNPANNNASLNSGWNFFYQCFQPTEYLDLEKYDFFKVSKEPSIGRSYYTKVDSMPLRLNGKPNLVLIVLESFNAYLSKYYGGLMSHTPFLDSLSQNAMRFTNCYAGTNRTDKALACINSGYPGTPWNSILNQPEKAVKLPQISILFKQNGYNCTFSYGGDLNFASMKTYLQAGGFNQLLDVDYYKKGSKVKASKWGIHDEVIFNERASNEKVEPFFEEILSLSSHEPFDVPYNSPQQDEKYGPFYNSVEYTDQCLREYFRKVKTKKWYPNTVFIITSDHGRDVGADRELASDSIRYKIPLLIFGEPLKGHNAQINKVTSQTDLAFTIAQLFNLEMSKNYFPYSRNLFFDSNAFFFTNGGWGLVQQEAPFTSFQNKYYMNHSAEGPKDLDIKYGAAIQYELLKYYKSL